jgi:O-antigen/teichoic acid export membrane protein
LTPGLDAAVREARRWPRISALRRNVAANLVGRAWVMALGIAFIPIYLKFLGIEAYGLVGFFATLQAVFGLLDLGLGATINREMARLSVGVDRRAQQRTLLRTLEACYWAISLTTGLLVLALAPAIAHHWVQPSALSPVSVERAIRLMGLVLALQLPFAFYQAALMGLQRQVAVNGILIVTATARSVGTALVLWKVAASVEAFFICQLIVSLVQIAGTLAYVWFVVGGGVTARPDFARLGSIWRYAAATSANSIVGIALTQTDKVLLSRLLPLEQFGYYALAGTMASFVWAVVIPVNQALFPRFAQLVELGDRATLSALYHRASQVMTVAVVPAAATVVLFAWQLIRLWTRNPITADHTALIAALLIAGTTMNALVSVPGYLQSAAGWPSLMVYTNLAAAIVLVPAILVVAPRYGAAGAACVWLVLNAGYLLFNVPAMHRRLLRGELWRWYRADLAAPALGAIAAAAIGRALMPAAASSSAWLTAAWIAGVGLLALTAAVLLAGDVRPGVLARLAAVRS